jgi:hypothetical protein
MGSQYGVQQAQSRSRARQGFWNCRVSTVLFISFLSLMDARLKEIETSIFVSEVTEVETRK